MRGEIIREIYDKNLNEKIRLKRLDNGKIVFTVIPLGERMEDLKCMERPMFAHIRLTSRCNLNCSYCYTDDNVKKPDMSDMQVMELIDTCNNKGIMNITWTGGEPLLRNNFYDVVIKTNKYGMNQTILTNGLLINQLELNEMPKENITFQISLNNIWENPPYKDRIIENAKLLVRNKFNVILSVMLEAVDIETIRGLITHLIENKIPAVRFGMEIPIGGLKDKNMDKYEIEIKKLFCNLYRLRQEYQNCIKIFYQFDKDNYHDTGFPRRFFMCEAGTTQIYIDNNGDVYPCPLFKANSEFYCGNITENSWEELWNAFPMEQFRSIEECKGCNYSCKVWCRALIYNKKGSLSGISPYCLKTF